MRAISVGWASQVMRGAGLLLRRSRITITTIIMIVICIYVIVVLLLLLCLALLLLLLLLLLLCVFCQQWPCREPCRGFDRLRRPPVSSPLVKPSHNSAADKWGQR